MMEARRTLEWDQSALIWSVLANQNRNPEEYPRPFLPSLVHPTRTEDDYRNDGPGDVSQIKEIITRVNNGR